MAIEREVAGMRCGEVMLQLSEFLDGELAPEARSRVEAHLRGCDVCERFGGAFTAAIQALRRGGAPAEPAADPVFQRLARRIETLRAHPG